MPSCCAYNCTNRSGDRDLNGVKISFHRFPNPTKRSSKFKEWVTAIKVKNFVYNSNKRVCSSHFSEEDFDSSSLMRYRMLSENNNFMSAPVLNDAAVPNLNSRTSDTMTSAAKRAPRKSSVLKKHQSSDVSGENKNNTSAVNNSTPTTSNAATTQLNEIASTSSESSENGMPAMYVITENSVPLRPVHESTAGSDDLCVSSSDEDSEDDIEPDSSDFSDVSDNENEVEPDSNSVNAVIVFLACLLPLFQICHVCGKKTLNTKQSFKGANLSIKTECVNGHTYVWNSQLMLNRQPLGNVMICSAVFLSGLPRKAYETFSRALNILFVAKSSFYKILNTFVSPCILNFWLHHRAANILEIEGRNDDLRIAGDVQSDSLGHNANLCILSIFCILTGKIIDFAAIKQGLIKGDMEKNVTDCVLTRLVHQFGDKIPVTHYLSDQHTEIRKLINFKFPQINHKFTVEHLCKSFIKNLQPSLKLFPLLNDWKCSIYNHLWYCLETCNNDGDLLIEKFISILNHVCNIHEWNYGHQLFGCDHENIGHESRGKKWLKIGSQEHKALKNAVLNTRFLNDLKHAKLYLNTDELDSYHSARSRFTPKRTHSSYSGYVLRSILAILDHNSNVGRNIIEGRKKFVWSKTMKAYRKKNVYEPKSDAWLLNLMKFIMKNAMQPNPALQEENTGHEKIIFPFLPSQQVATPQANLENCSQFRKRNADHLQQKQSKAPR